MAYSARSGFGLRPARHLNGSNCFSTMTFPASGLNHEIWIGSPVILGGVGGVVEHSATGGGPLVGVVRAVYGTAKNRPKTHSQPDGGPYIASSGAGFVEVYTDPDIIYEVVMDSAATGAAIGQLTDIVASLSGNPKTGVSYTTMDASLNAAQTSANVQTLPFRVVGLGMKDTAPAGVGYGRNQIVEVMINNHFLRQVAPT